MNTGVGGKLSFFFFAVHAALAYERGVSQVCGHRAGLPTLEHPAWIFSNARIAIIRQAGEGVVPDEKQT